MWSPRIVICRSSRIAQSAGPLPNTGEITLRNLHDLAEALRLIGFRGQSKHLMWRPTLRAAYRSLPALSQAKTISTLTLPKFTQGSFSKLSPSLGAKPSQGQTALQPANDKICEDSTPSKTPWQPLSASYIYLTVHSQHRNAQMSWLLQLSHPAYYRLMFYSSLLRGSLHLSGLLHHLSPHLGGLLLTATATSAIARIVFASAQTTREKDQFTQRLAMYPSHQRVCKSISFRAARILRAPVSSSHGAEGQPTNVSPTNASPIWCTILLGDF